MATWALPFSSKKRAEEFAKRMASPWIVKVTTKSIPALKTISIKQKSGAVKQTKRTIAGKIKEIKVIEIDALARLAGSDALFDAIQDRANRLKKSFDSRPLIKRFLKQSLKQTVRRPSLYNQSAVSIVQKALGIKTERKK